MTDLPAPPVPPDLDLRDYTFMPLDVVRLRDSAIIDAVRPIEFKAAVILWCASWHQVPAGSLPDDDIQLAKLAGYGRVIKEWAKVRGGALYGFILCNDGRFYHPVIAEKALEAWEGKRKASARGMAGAVKRWGLENANAPNSDSASNGASNAQACRKNSKGEERIGTGQDRERKGNRLSSASRPEVIEKFWAKYPPRDGDKGKAVAEKKLLKLLAHGVSAEEILAGVTAYRRYCDENNRTGTEFVAMASTWLNQRRWEDYTKPQQNGRHTPDRRLTQALGDTMTERLTERGFLAFNESTKWLEWTDAGLKSEEYRRLSQ